MYADGKRSAYEKVRQIARTRTCLLVTCLLSRQMVLEVWKKETAAIVFGSEGSGVLNWAAFGGEVAGFLDELIKYVCFRCPFRNI